MKRETIQRFSVRSNTKYLMCFGVTMDTVVTVVLIKDLLLFKPHIYTSILLFF